MPFTEIEIIDDWHVLGLAGTGSRSLLLRDVFVPEHRCVLLSELLAGTPPGAAVHPDYPLVRAPRGLMVNYSLPPVAIALGNRALAVALASLRERVRAASTRMAESEFVQMTVAEAAAAIDAATLTMHSGRAAAEALVANGEPIPQDIVLRTRRDMTYAQHQVQRAVERLVEVCGARSVYDAEPLAAIRRDLLTVLTHNVASRQAAMGAGAVGSRAGETRVQPIIALISRFTSPAFSMCGRWPTPSSTCTRAGGAAASACATGMILSSRPQITCTGIGSACNAATRSTACRPCGNHACAIVSSACANAVQSLVAQELLDHRATDQ